MLRFIRPAALTAAAALAVGFTTALTADAAPATAAECVRAGLVWVSVEYDDTVTGGCAEQFSTASAALLSAGLVTSAESYVTVVDGRAADGTAREWWSVYSKGALDDGTYPADWDFAQVGVLELALEPSDVLAMVLQPDWNVMATPPVTDPVEGIDLDEPAEIPSPEPGPTTDPEPSPTTDPEPSPTTDPEPTATASPTPGGSPSTRPGGGAAPGLPSSGN